MLLWVFMLSLCAAAVALFSNNLPRPCEPGFWRFKA